MAIPGNEDARLRALKNLRILDTPPEDRFDQIVGLAARVFDVPISYISMVDMNRQWFKSKHGIDMVETPRDISFCGHAILQNDPLIVPDLTYDARFSASPLVTGIPHARFYAGMPVSVSDGVNVGTLCVLDTRPRSLSDGQVRILRDMGNLVEQQLQLIDTIELQQESIRLKEELIESQRDLAEEKEKTDALLRNILPDDIAKELKAFGRVEARHLDDVNVLIADFSGFTALTEKLSAEELLEELNVCFGEFDRITDRHDVEKLKTIGDAYLCLSGMTETTADPAGRILNAAFEIRDFIADRRREKAAAGEEYWDVRIGIHRGPLVAGVVGTRKFAFDVWGDTVNTASRFESNGEPGRINVSGEFMGAIRDRVDVVERGLIAMKGKSDAPMFFVDRRTT
ncbi:MAG: adenylate/guanylate cyclase domain-containing protein [Chthoniobacterales bacterium]